MSNCTVVLGKESACLLSVNHSSLIAGVFQTKALQATENPLNSLYFLH
jgi:hypothetical protein